ncbi:MAG: cupin domain-containing protein [candidate division Zixibacteria bacterium]|nr:cupin domain-containing protein [candidate division Zixibacteria bacterium]MDH3936841.1 cupin domain-containing protein [candidate division Zixibacteria bacterium]MDH4033134.1 cupin domain-containing protein [candidate division Zixibacteria bacterium]
MHHEIKSINLAERLASFDETWVPKIVGELNDQYVKVVKFVGEYVWHQHDEQDELFLVLHGSMKLELEDKSIELTAGELVIVPRQVRHRPVADELCEVLLFEPVSTRNTGDVDHPYTIEPDDLEAI